MLVKVLCEPATYALDLLVKVLVLLVDVGDLRVGIVVAAAAAAADLVLLVVQVRDEAVDGLLVGAVRAVVRDGRRHTRLARRDERVLRRARGWRGRVLVLLLLLV